MKGVFIVVVVVLESSQQSVTGLNRHIVNMTTVATSVRVAVEGCCHGELDRIYAHLKQVKDSGERPVDLLLIAGDFQAVRNADDLECMACPAKYRHLHTFHEYYSGKKKAPVLTIFIGGNHEASNYLQELFYGGWVAPNIYYLGRAGVVNFRGLRIGGLSGIYKPHSYRKGHFETPPYDKGSMRSVYHVREYEMCRLRLLRQPFDIFLSHDWPTGVYHCGNTRELIRKKRFLEREVRTNTLGSPPAAELLHSLKPRYWFSAHMHVKFPAVVRHPPPAAASAAAPHPLPPPAPPPAPSPRGSVLETMRSVWGVGNFDNATRFLGLDKCLPKRDFMQIVDIEPSSPCNLSKDELYYDREWLAAVRCTQSFFPSIRFPPLFPPRNAIEAQMASTLENFDRDTAFHSAADMVVPRNFQATANAHDASLKKRQRPSQPHLLGNPQTDLLLEKLRVPFAPCQVPFAPLASASASAPAADPNEISLEDDEDV